MTAERYVDSIVDFCMKLQTFPARGSHVTICCHRTSRVPHFRKRAIIAYLLEAEAVSIGNVSTAAKITRQRLPEMRISRAR